LINFNLIDENDEEILNLIDKKEIYNIQDEIKNEISQLFETHLNTNQYSINLNDDLKTLVSNWEIKIYENPDNKEFPFLCALQFISEVPLNYLDLDTVTKVITESDFLPIEFTINDNNHEFKLLSNYSNLGNRTMNYTVRMGR
jgi:hypothetical protein